MQDPRISFDDNISESNVNKSVKLNSSSSRFSKKTINKDTFQQKAQDVHDKLEGYQETGFKLGKEFNEIIEKKVLSENKGILERKLETDIIQRLVMYAIAVNNDANEPQDGMGSVALITLLLNMITKLNDKILHNKYDISLLMSEIKQLKSEKKNG